MLELHRRTYGGKVSGPTSYFLERISATHNFQQLQRTFFQHAFPFRTTAPPNPVLRLFENTSYLNHSCSPNAAAVWNPETRLIEVRAVKEIKAGEEVHIAYAHHIQPENARWQALGFQCNCTMCHMIGQDFHDMDISLSQLDTSLKLLLAFKERHFLVTIASPVMGLMSTGDVDALMNHPDWPVVQYQASAVLKEANRLRIWAPYLIIA